MPLNTPDHTHVAATATRLVERIRSYGPVAVAYSGGVDSAVVAKAAFNAWDHRAVAVTAVSPSLAASELTIAREQARRIGIRHVELTTDEFTRSEYRRNSGDRCYFCKDTLYTLAASRLQELGVDVLVNGANVDDQGDHRPGMIAAREHDVRSPLIDERLTKADVRKLAHWWGLDVADKPAAPCLASRIAYGVEVTEERVLRVERAEAFLKSITDITELRVRVEAGELARIEVPRSELASLADPSLAEPITAEFKRLGFRSVTLDLEGFRSGSLNALLPVLTSQGPMAWTER